MRSPLTSRPAWTAASGPVRAAAGVIACALGLLLAQGCARTLPRAERGPVVGGQGGAWEVVFATPEVAAWAEGVGPEERPGHARRDGTLNIRSAEPMLAANQWPEPARPTIERSRRIYLSDSPRSHLFFLPPHPVHRPRPVHIHHHDHYHLPRGRWYP